MKTKTTYVIALMHIANLLAQSLKEAKRGDAARAVDFTREADKISLSIFDRAASELL